MDEARLEEELVYAIMELTLEERIELLKKWKENDDERKRNP